MVTAAEHDDGDSSKADRRLHSKASSNVARLSGAMSALSR